MTSAIHAAVGAASSGGDFGGSTVAADENGDSDTTTTEEIMHETRDDDVNPYWIEDRDLKNGPIDFLPGVEVSEEREDKLKGGSKFLPRFVGATLSHTVRKYREETEVVPVQRYAYLRM